MKQFANNLFEKKFSVSLSLVWYDSRPCFHLIKGKNNTRTSASIRVFIHVKKECLISNQAAQEKGKFLSFAVPSLVFISGVQRFKGLFIVESALSLSS